ncbi:MAG: hypothetical protein AAB215_01800, partial [Planctomycetota bacterium]
MALFPAARRPLLSLLSLGVAASAIPGLERILPDGARFLLALSAVFFVPGAVLDARLDPEGAARDGRLLRLPWAFLWGLSLLTALSTLAILARISWGAFGWVLILLPPAAILFAPRREGTAPASWRPPGMSGTAFALLLVFLLAGVAVCLRAGVPIADDSAGHLAVIRNLLGAPDVGLPREIFYPGEPLDPRYAFSTWHVILAGTASVALADPLAAWLAAPCLIFLMPVLAWAVLDRALRGSVGGIALAVGAFVFGIAGHPAVRLAGYYQFPAFYVSFPLLAVLALREASNPSAKNRLLGAAVLFATASTNPFYGGALPLAA